MARITQSTRLSRVQHIVGSGTGVLDFAVDGEDDYYTWDGNEDADWEVEDVASIQNIDEDRYIMYPEGNSSFAKSNHRAKRRTPGQFTVGVSRR